MISDQPLFMPKGSVRALLSLGLVAGSFVCLYTGVITFEQLMVLDSVVLAFYFKSKKDE